MHTLLPGQYYRKEAIQPLSVRIAWMIVSMRYECGWSQEQLAIRAGTSQPYIARLESGRELPNLAMLDRIAKAFDTRISFAFVGAKWAPRAVNSGKIGMKLRWLHNVKMPDTRHLTHSRVSATLPPRGNPTAAPVHA